MGKFEEMKKKNEINFNIFTVVGGNLIFQD